MELGLMTIPHSFCTVMRAAKFCKGTDKIAGLPAQNPDHTLEGTLKIPADSSKIVKIAEDEAKMLGIDENG